MDKLKRKIKKKVIIILLSIFTPLIALQFLLMIPLMATAGTGALTPGMEEEQTNEVKRISNKCNLNLEEFVAYITVKHDNDFKEINLEEEALNFMIVNYIKHEQVVVDRRVEWVEVDKGILATQKEILQFSRNTGCYPAEAGKVADHLKELDRSEEYDITIESKEMRDVYDELNEEQQEWYSVLISENIIKELVGTYYELPEEIIIETTGFFAWPVPGTNRITSYFGWRTDPIYDTQQYHYGIDIAEPGCKGEPVIASADGIVIAVSYRTTGYGYSVTIAHSDKENKTWQTRYAHLSQIDVEKGEEVRRGKVIGAIGNTGKSTGPHLHFEIMYQGIPIDPLTIIS